MPLRGPREASSEPATREGAMLGYWGGTSASGRDRSGALSAALPDPLNPQAFCSSTER